MWEPDYLLISTILYYLMPLLLAVLGVIVSIKPQPKERHIMLIIFFVFLMLIIESAKDICHGEIKKKIINKYFMQTPKLKNVF